MKPIRRHWRKIASALLIVCAGLLAGMQLGSGGTGPSAPPYAHSWYISNLEWSYMWHLGYTDGQRDNVSCTNSLVVLDFGQPDKLQNQSAYGGYGAWDYAGPTSASQLISDADIEIAAEGYATGWYTSSGTCARLHIAVGTNNYNQIPTGAGIGGVPGQAGFWWSAIGSDLTDFLSPTRSNYSWQITAWTGDDMEQPCQTCDPPQLWDCANPGSKTREFVDGYSYNTVAPILLDYGAAWVPNPPPQYNGDPIAGTCWSSADVYYVAYQKTLDYPLPEIYTSQATDSWINVRIWAGQHSYNMIFKGVMTECPQGDTVPSNCQTIYGPEFSPSQAWYDLWNKLNANGYGQASLDYATNIHFQNQ